MRARLAIVAALVATPAFADKAPVPTVPTADLTKRVEALASRAGTPSGEAPQFAFTGNLTLDQPRNLDEATTGLPDTALADAGKTLVIAPDADTAVVSAHLGEYYGCGTSCGKPASDSWLRTTAVLEKRNGAWQPLAWSITPSIRSTSQQDATEDKIVPDTITRTTTGADAVVKQFETTAGDPKAFAASFSPRKEVVLFGSELAERFVGAKAKAQILAWNMGFTVRDGVRAGMSKSGNVAWIAANVDAKSLKRANATAIPFRMFVVYEKTGATWSVVQIQFSTAV